MGVDGRIILKEVEGIGCVCGLSSCGSGYEPIAGCSEQVLTTS